MLEWWYLAQVWYGLFAGLLLVLMGLIGRKPSGFSLALVIGSEFGLLMQLVATITVLLLGESSVGDTWEFFGYLLVALVVPIGGAFWALVEKSKWSTVVMGAAILTVVVMLVRMRQIWTGEVLEF
ncbi:MAG: hypothetical protein K9G13_05810 [Aquiluna sp.]|nr:hypothetical protein [Aquiluna sp.]MCF8546034.1 hypothetical protein [Aquiluna sp.]